MEWAAFQSRGGEELGGNGSIERPGWTPKDQFLERLWSGQWWGGWQLGGGEGGGGKEAAEGQR